MTRIAKNAPCPCGSGKKFKSCCMRNPKETGPYTQEQREQALWAIEDFCERPDLDQEYALAEAELWGEQFPRMHEVDEYWMEVSINVCDSWFWFDRPLPDGRTPADALLATRNGLDAGGQAWLSQMRQSTMRLYEVVGVVPGVSVTVADLIDGGAPTVVSERTFSRSARRGEVIAVRVVPEGASGRPEFEMTVLSIPPLLQGAVVVQLTELRQFHRTQYPSAPASMFWAQIPPFIHDAWVSALINPVVPKLRNTDGDELVWSRARFQVADVQTLTAALDAHERLVGEGDGTWAWLAGDPDSKPTLLGNLSLEGNQLLLECNSVQRAERGRALVEAVAGEATRFIASSHEDTRKKVSEAARSRPAKRGRPRQEPAIPKETADKLLQSFYDQHYRDWVDQPLPALGGATPRAAARTPDGRTRVADLVRGIEDLSQASLRRGEPAYDASWMWQELGLEDAKQG